MAEIPPWLIPPNFLAASEAGARIGAEQSKTAADLLARQQELAVNAGLGYARINAETAQAAAAQKAAEARLALQSNRYSDLANLGQEGHQLGEERLADLQTQRGAANDLKQNQLDLATQKFQSGEADKQQAYDLALQRLSKVTPDRTQAQQQAQIEAEATAKFVNAVKGGATKEQALADNPAAAKNPITHSYFNPNIGTDKPLPPAQVTTFTGNSEVRYPVPAAQAAAALGTNALGAVPAAPRQAQQQFKLGDQAVQNGVTYQFDGQKWNPVQ